MSWQSCLRFLARRVVWPVALGCPALGSLFALGLLTPGRGHDHKAETTVSQPFTSPPSPTRALVNSMDQPIGEDPTPQDAERELPADLGDDAAAWVAFDGSEQVILGDLSTLNDGAAVQIVPVPVQTEMAGAKPNAAAKPGRSD